MSNKMKTVQKTAAALVLTMLSSTVMAAAIDPADDFYALWKFIDDAATGGLAMAISLTALLIGAGIGAAKGSIMPAIGGVLTAAVFGFGPDLISNLVTNGALI